MKIYEVEAHEQYEASTTYCITECFEMATEEARRVIQEESTRKYGKDSVTIATWEDGKCIKQETIWERQ